MEREELLSKLDLIEEQARLTLAEFPQHRRLITDSSPTIGEDPEATVRLPS